MLGHVPLGPLPSLHLLRRSLGATFVRRFPRYYGAVRLPAPVHHGRAPEVHRADLAITHQARCRASRVPHTVFRYMQRSPTPPGPFPPHPNGVYGVAFRVFGARRHPGVARFRGSILCLYLPLSTLRRRRYRRLRMTRGQCGWLDLHWQGLAPFTTVPACPGAYPNARRQAPPMAEATQERRLLAVACKPSLGQGSCRDAASGFFSSPVSWQPTPTPFVHYCLSDDFFSVAVLLDGRKSGRKTPLG
jgi:hypothetical protein